MNSGTSSEYPKGGSGGPKYPIGSQTILPLWPVSRNQPYPSQRQKKHDCGVRVCPVTVAHSAFSKCVAKFPVLGGSFTGGPAAVSDARLMAWNCASRCILRPDFAATSAHRIGSSFVPLAGCKRRT